MIKKIFASVALFAVAILGVTSCGKNGGITPSSTDECTIKGRIVRDCSGTPLANYPLSIYQKSNSLGSVGGVRGTGATDNDGNFIIHLSKLNEMPIEVERESSDPNHGPEIFAIILPSTLKNFGSSAVNDLGKVYLESTVNILMRFHLARQYGPHDTLYVGDDAFSAKKIYPITEGALVAFSSQAFGNSDLIGLNSANSTQDMYWGIGANDFDSAYHYYQYTPGAPRHQIKSKIGICVQADTTAVILQ